ncbi:hypothetical protein EON65_15430 [archaeon]|nr:MAG: hypothetical protein EON65_15430 [archaeon]
MTTTAPDKPMATITRILSVNPISGADSIESVKVLGWKCVFKKNEFKVGDLCVYFVIGTLFPETYERTAFMEGKPLKTKKLRGCISQGLVAPLTWLLDFGVDIDTLTEGQDVTSYFNIQKHVEPEETHIYTQLKGAAAKEKNPSYFPRTDEERIQNIPEILQELKEKNSEIVITRKEDGCSATFVLKDGKLMVCGRNSIQDDLTTPYFKVERRLRIGDKMLALGRNLAVQGEIVGPSVQSNRLKLPDLTYRVFYIYDLDAGEFLAHEELEAVAASLELETVPVLYKGPASAAPMLENIDTLLTYADTIEYASKTPAEGIVVKINERTASRVSFKVISNKFLLKYNL